MIKFLNLSILILITVSLSACSSTKGDFGIKAKECRALNHIIKGEFDLYSSDEYKNNCGDRCDGIARETKVLDVFLSSKDNKCYLGQEILGVEGVSYYEVQEIEKDGNSYRYVGNPTFSATCIEEYLFETAWDTDTLTDSTLDADKKEIVCDYISGELENALRHQIQDLK